LTRDLNSQQTMDYVWSESDYSCGLTDS